MKDPIAIARLFPCRLPEETILSRFHRRLPSGEGLIVTLNTGFE